MAFRIQRTQRSLPERAGGYQTDINLSTGKGAIAQGIAALGGGLMGLGESLHRLEAENQFSEAKRQLGETLNTLWEDFQRDPDSSTYQERFKIAMASAKDFMPKNALAARGFQQLINQVQVDGQATVNQIRLKREQDNFYADQIGLIADGKIDQAEVNLQAGLKRGLIDPKPAGHLIHEIIPAARTQYQYKLATQLAIQNPETLLNFIRADGRIDPALGYDRLDVGHGQALRNIAENSLIRRQQAINTQAANDLSQLYDYALDPKADVAKAQDLVNGWTWADGAKKIEGVERFLKLQEMHAKHKQLLIGSPVSQSSSMNAIMNEMDGFFDDIADLYEAQDVRAAKIKARILLNERVGTSVDKTYKELIEQMMDVQRAVEQELEGAATELELLPPIKSPRVSEETGVSEEKRSLPLEDALAPYVVATGVALAMKRPKTEPAVQLEAPLDENGSLSVEVFYEQVASLKALGRIEEARAYYDKWSMVLR